MGDSSLSKLTVILLPLTFVSLVLYAVGFGSPHWLKASFQLPGPYINPALPATVMVPVDANMGLFKSCSVVTVNFPPGHSTVTEDCSSDGAADWQWVAAGAAIFGLVMSVVSLVGTGLVVVVAKVRGNRKIQVVAAAASFCTAVGATISLILYGLNREFQHHTFEISWAYALCATAAGSKVFIFTLHVIDVLTRNKGTSAVTTGEERVNYYSNTSSVTVIGGR